MRNLCLVVVMAYIAGACSHLPIEDSHHEEYSLDFTLYTPTAELFVEFQALIKGDSITFGAHLTQLADYKPFSEGILTVSLSGGGFSQSAKARVSTIDGIFRPVFVPMKEGIYSLEFEWKNKEYTEVFFIDSIRVYSSDEDAESHLHENHTYEDAAIKFTKEQSWKTEFETMQIHPKPFSEVIYTSGQIMPAQGDETTLTSPFSGIISFKGTSLVSGTAVQYGEKIIWLSGKGMSGDNISVDYIRLKSEFEKARTNFERQQLLVADKIVSEQDFLETKANYEQAKAAFENITASADGGKMAITANLTGFVKSVFVTEGSFVEAGTALVSIAQNKQLMIRADVSQTHWHCLPNITEANFLTPYDGKLYNTNQLDGKLLSYSHSTSNSSWSAPVYFAIRNSGELISGSYIEVYLLAKSANHALSVPISALIEEQGNFFLFVQHSGETFEKREVKTGVSNGKEIEITSGLIPGERIVSKGAFQIKLASVSSVLPSHNHDH